MLPMIKMTQYYNLFQLEQIMVTRFLVTIKLEQIVSEYNVDDNI